MNLTDSEDTITITLSDGEVAMTLSDCVDWNSTVASMIFTDIDGTNWQWNIDSQAFQQV